MKLRKKTIDELGSAALFALRSPLSKGVILADEVGLGKTIEAGIVIAQRWTERHRSILLIVPATTSPMTVSKSRIYRLPE